MNITYIRRAIFRVLKQNKWIFYAFEWMKWHKEIEYHKVNNDPALLKSKSEIKREERLVRKYWRLGTFHYYRYGLQYKHLTDEEILDYVPTFYFHKNIERKHQGIDTIKYGDKLTQAKLFEERGIPSAKVIAIYRGGRCTNIDETATIDLQKLVTDALYGKNNKLFFKPSSNCGGAGILVLKYNGESLILNGDPIESLDVLRQQMNNRSTYIIEENIIQADSINAIYASSVNTIRVAVQRENDRMSIKTTILRMGRAGKEVDNNAQGGLSIYIDPTNGKFADIATAEHGGGALRCHPDSGYTFSGNGIEDWNKIKGEIDAIANKLIDFNDIALDIAITNRGAMIIEFNFRYGVEHQQCVVGGVRKILNIPNK